MKKGEFGGATGYTHHSSAQSAREILTELPFGCLSIFSINSRRSVLSDFLRCHRLSRDEDTDHKSNRQVINPHVVIIPEAR